MMRIKALNEEDEGQDEGDGEGEGEGVRGRGRGREEKGREGPSTREALEKSHYSLYAEALNHLKEGEEEEAKSNLLALDTALKTLRSSGQRSSCSSSDELHFLALKNLGVLFPNQLNYYLDALEINNEDLLLWIEAGQRAFQVVGDYQLARNCFECAHHLSPFNWIVTDKLLDTYFVLHDLWSCFALAVEALNREATYDKARVLLREVCRLHPPLKAELTSDSKKWLIPTEETETLEADVLDRLRQLKAKRRQRFEEDNARCEAKRPKLTLTLDSWESMSLQVLGSKILRLFHQMKKDDVSMITAIDVLFDSSQRRDETPNASTDESTSDDNEKDKEKDKEKEREKDKVKVKEKVKSVFSRSSSGNSFPTEFLDKRRSSRVQKIQSKSRDGSDRCIYESLLDLIPNSIKSRTIQVKESKPTADQVVRKTSSEIEAEIVKSFISKQKSCKHLKNVRRISDLLCDYVYEVSRSSTSINIPECFVQIYRAHREQFELPFAPYVVIGEHIHLDEVHAILTANEVKYDRTEGQYLIQMTVPMRYAVDDDNYNKFLIRVLVLRGTREGLVDHLEEAQELLSSNPLLEIVETTNKNIISVSSLKSLINSQCESSLTNLVETQKHQELIELLVSKPESEISEIEEDMLYNAILKSSLWDRGVSIISGRHILTEKRLKALERFLESGRRGKVTIDLMKRVVKYATEKVSTVAWDCLFWAFVAEEPEGGGVEVDGEEEGAAVERKRKKEKKENEKRMTSLMTLGHQYLGKKGKCTAGRGEFLLLCLDYLLNRSCSNVDDLVLQSFSCLYGYPSRKTNSSFFQNHATAPTIDLSWEQVPMVYHYFVSEDLPEFDSLYKINTIGSETEQLLCKILPLVPNHLKPETRMQPIHNYINSGKPIDPEFKPEPHVVTQNLYYFLADYYFKYKEFKKAKVFFKYDLCMSPDRFDSWAASALSRSSLLDKQLISGDHLTNSADIVFRGAASTFRCYARALELDPSNTKLWIEYGSSAYNLSSFASRLRKAAVYYSTGSRGDIGSDVTRLLEKQKEMLATAKFCFEKANSTDCTEEIWLHYYLLGKIAEKSDLLQALHYYEQADLHLFINGASYPKKIAYNNPPSLAFEALEVHFRTHAAALKGLTSGKRVSPRVLNKIHHFLVRALRSSFVKQTNYTPFSVMLDHDYASGAPTSSSSQGRNVDSVSELVSDLTDAVCVQLKSKKEKYVALKKKLIKMCLNAMYRCLTRFPAHYKSLYRLAYYYSMIGEFKLAKNILMTSFNTTSQSHSFKAALSAGDRLGAEEPRIASTSSATSAPVPSTSLNLQESSHSKETTIAGLFAERRNNNLFNGIWRIPIDDIDRPGSFSSHMYRSTLLLIRVSTATFDYQNLCTLAIQLNRTPEVGKKYLRDTDRLRLAREAYESCAVILKKQLLDTRQPAEMEATVNEINRVADKLMKANIYTQEAGAFISSCYQLIT